MAKSCNPRSRHNRVSQSTAIRGQRPISHGLLGPLCSRSPDMLVTAPPNDTETRKAPVRPWCGNRRPDSNAASQPGLKQRDNGSLLRLQRHIFNDVLQLRRPSSTIRSLSSRPQAKAVSASKLSAGSSRWRAMELPLTEWPSYCAHHRNTVRTWRGIRACQCAGLRCARCGPPGSSHGHFCALRSFWFPAAAWAAPTLLTWADLGRILIKPMELLNFSNWGTWAHL
jgi:hypothetical protein